MLGGISKIIKTIVGKSESVQKRKTIQLIGNKKVVKYDGNVHQVEGFVNETFLVDNKTFSVRYASYMATGKDFGSYLPKLEGNVTIYNSKGVDVTEKFEIEIIPGELRVEKRNIILQSASGVHEYDGQNYSLNSIEIKGDGLVNGEDIIYSCSGSLYLPGEVNNSIVCSFGIMTNPDNYNIELVEGNLKIVDRKIPYTIILEYPDQVFTYAGMEVQVEQPCEKNIVIDGINYIVKNILAKAEGKNVGEYDYVIDSLSSKDFCSISNGSACNSKSYSPSYVLLAMGIPKDQIESSVRISWGHDITIDEIEKSFQNVIEAAKGLVW